MGRGASKAGGSTRSGGTYLVKSVTVQSGSTIDLSDTPLAYGNLDPSITDAQRKVLEAQESKRLKAKVEYGQVVDENGLPRGQEYKGGRNGVYVPGTLLDVENSAFTHNHPRGKGEEGCLGGTFSNADLNTFANRNVKTFRASAAEGTYSITKTSLFDSQSFKNYANKIESDAHARLKKENSALASKVRAGNISYDDYLSGSTKAFNTFLVDVHNGLLAGQEQYGYKYTLERR